MGQNRSGVKSVEDHALLNAVTVRYIREALESPSAGPFGEFKGHPLLLRRHEYDNVLVDYSVLYIRMPLSGEDLPRTEVGEMLQPLAELCQSRKADGETLPDETWVYEWYYLELLDRDERVEPICWIRPELLYKEFPDDRAPTVHTVGRRELVYPAPYSHQLATMDAVARRASYSIADPKDTEQWRHWLVGTWREQERHWIEEGLLIHEQVKPWTRLLAFDATSVVRDEQAASGLDDGAPGTLLERMIADAGYPGLYWTHIPVYDRRRLGSIWDAMKHEMFVTSVFNLAAGPAQQPALWERLEDRFVVPFQRMSRYDYLVRLREQKVLEWSRAGKTIAEMADLLIDDKLYTLDEDAADTISRLPQMLRSDMYHDNAERQVRRIRRRLCEDGLIEKRKPGRPRKRSNDEHPE